RLYALQDANWNVTALTNTAGDAVERYVYDAYGRPTALTGVSTSRAGSLFDWEYGYTGRCYDRETRVYDFRYRQYASNLALFVGRDPRRYYDGRMALYEFLESRPTSTRDPLGTSCASSAEMPFLDPSYFYAGDQSDKLYAIGHVAVTSASRGKCCCDAESPLETTLEVTFTSYDAINRRCFKPAIDHYLEHWGSYFLDDETDNPLNNIAGAPMFSHFEKPEWCTVERSRLVGRWKLVGDRWRPEPDAKPPHCPGISMKIVCTGNCELHNPMRIDISFGEKSSWDRAKGTMSFVNVKSRTKFRCDTCSSIIQLLQFPNVPGPGVIK
ncbi:MAG: hypothetical protein KDA59_18560, partial [Planctomycetales bacterium]|nr:hypothetical protein [Planctomycetales bacterium]